MIDGAVMMQVKKLTRDAYEEKLRGLDATVPVEQLPVWQDFEQTIPGREPWGFVSIERDGETAALVSFMQYETHGYRYLRAHHAPVWTVAPTPEQETEALEALAAFVRAEDAKQVFIRLAVFHDLPACEPCLSTLPYDTTVIIDLSGTTEDILSRMKPRGRRDVRKALRECPAELADETERAAESFEEYYEVMCQTGERDGFVPAPLSDYQSMVRLLGADHCRVFAGRVDGKLVAWSLVTVSGTRATRYYAATAVGAGRLRVADTLVLFECERAAQMGCTEYDLMGIGSEFAPETMNLNEFKTKFAKDGVTVIAPDRDLPLKKGFYRALVTAKGLRSKLRNRKNGEEE